MSAQSVPLPPPLSSPAAPPDESAAAPTSTLNNASFFTRFVSFVLHTPPEKAAYLGVGAVLYLNFLRALSLIFFAQAIITIDSVVSNANGAAGTTLASTDNDFLEYISLSTSLVNLVSRSYTGPVLPDYCNGHGFASQACAAGGWSQGSPSAYDYACGVAPPSLTPKKSLVYQWLTGSLDVKCSNFFTKCSCFPGYSGFRCEVIENATIARRNAFCTPPPQYPWWTMAAGSTERSVAQAAALRHRSADACTSNGACVVRVLPSAPNTPVYSFCSCDSGWLGRNCSVPDRPGPGVPGVHGLLLGTAVTSAKASSCEQGSLPSVSYSVGDVFPFPRYKCGDHGFGEHLLVQSTGQLLVSNFYRVQTPSLCFCEPGYWGEQCLGGPGVPFLSGIEAIICCALLFIALFVLYRSRRHAEQNFDDVNVTPRDFTILVNHLPTLTWERDGGGASIDRIRAHFEQFGPVHAVQAAPTDEDIYYLQQEKNAALLALHVLRERAAHASQVGSSAPVGAIESVRVTENPLRAGGGGVDGVAAAGGGVEWGARPVAGVPDTPNNVRAPRPFSSMWRRYVDGSDVWYTSPTGESVWTLPDGEIAVDWVPHDEEMWRRVVHADGDVYFVAPWGEVSWELPYGASFVDWGVDSLHTPEAPPEEATSTGLPHFPVWMPLLPPASSLAVLIKRGLAPLKPLSLPPHTTIDAIYEGNVPAAPPPLPDADAPPPPALNFFTSLAVRLHLGAKLLTASVLTAHIKLLDAHIAVAAAEAENFRFHRAFVTFAFSADMHDCLDAYRDAEHSAVKLARRVVINAVAHPIKRALRCGRPVDPSATINDLTHVDSPNDDSIDFYQSRLDQTRRVHLGFSDGDQSGAGTAAHSMRVLVGAKPRLGIVVRQAPEPDEVLWDSLDTGPKELSIRFALTGVYSIFLAYALWRLVININQEKPNGGAGFGMALLVVVLNILIGHHWAIAAELEQHYTLGSRMRSIYFKTLVTQCITTILGGVLGTYGFPADTRNGFIPDWYRMAGSFVLRTILIETVLPPMMNFVAPKYRISLLLSRSTTSFTQWAMEQTPPTYRLELRCAALMRTVLLTCAFNAGMPILNLAVAMCLFVRWLADSYAIENLFRIQKTGSELPRALEVSLAVALSVQVTASWIFLTPDANNGPTQIAFVVFLSLLAWATCGYVSFKFARGRDCCCGASALLPMVSFSCCVRHVRHVHMFAKRLMATKRHLHIESTAPVPTLDKRRVESLIEAIHGMYMRLLFGEFFFGEYEDEDDETEGKSYEQLVEEVHGYKSADAVQTARLTYTSMTLLRKWPYRLRERSQVFPDDYSTEPDPPIWTGKSMLEWSTRRRNGVRA